jgi:regulator of RNase E activity RraB
MSSVSRLFLMLFVSLIAAFTLLACEDDVQTSAQGGADAAVLDTLKAAGSDLSKPHDIEFFIYVPSREAAERASIKVRELNFTTTIDRAATGAQWLVLATKSMIPKLADIIEVGNQLTAIASAEGGEYDGWGTPVVE